VEFSVHRLSLPNTYSYVQEENLGSTRKFEEKKYLLFTCINSLTAKSVPAGMKLILFGRYILNI
jgi:hypothetical protein